MSFDKAFARTVGIEGGYSNDPDDSGGETNWGITKATAVAYGYTGPMRDMPRETAHGIYLNGWWRRLMLDRIEHVAGEGVAEELFDTAVNRGAGVAATYLQRCLNVLNLRGTLYADIKVDGSIGPVTVMSLASFIRHRGAPGARVLLKALNALQGADYIGLAEMRVKDERFVYGWIDNRVELPAAVA